MKKIILEVLFLVLVPLFIGFIIYLFFRSPEVLMVNYLLKFDLVVITRGYAYLYKDLLPNWFIYSLPDGLWAFSFLNSLILLRIKNGLKYIIGIILITTIGSEFLQLTPLLYGTFDVYDLYAYIIAIFISLMYFYLDYKNNMKRGEVIG